MKSAISKALSVVFCATTVLSAQDPLDAVVRLYATRAKTCGAQVGSGVFIDNKGTILTAYHVVQGAQALEIYGTGVSAKSANLAAYDETRDLALISVSVATPQLYLPIGPVPQKLTKIVATGYGNPGGKGGSAITIHFFRDTAFPSSQYPKPDGGPLFALDNVKLLGLDATLNRGMSGGPVVVDGKVIAIISGSEAPDGHNLGWAIPAADLQSMKNPNGRSFEDLPTLKLLNGPESGSLLKTSLPSARFDRLTAFMESVQKSQSQHQRHEKESAGFLSATTVAIGTLSAQRVSQKDRQTALQRARDIKLSMDVLHHDYKVFLEVSLTTLEAAQEEFQNFVRSRDALSKIRGDLANSESKLKQQERASPELQQQLGNIAAELKTVDSAIARGTALIDWLEDPSRFAIAISPTPQICVDSNLEELRAGNPGVVLFLRAVRDCRPKFLTSWGANLRAAVGLVDGTGRLIDYFSSPEIVEAISH